MQDTEQKCENCRFWRNPHKIPRGDALWGECRRNAPVAAFTTSKISSERPTWPHTFDKDWCGAWQETS